MYVIEIKDNNLVFIRFRTPPSDATSDSVGGKTIKNLEPPPPPTPQGYTHSYIP